MRRRMFCAAAVAGALALAGCGGGGDKTSTTPAGGSAVPALSFAAGTTMASIHSKGKLVLGTKFDQPGFGLKNPTNNQVQGFDIEVGKIIAHRLGLKDDQVEYVETVSKNREPFITDGKVDMVVATYTINDARKQVVSFAGPYYIAGQDIMVAKKNTTINGVNDLNGKKVCTVQGSTSVKNLREQAPQAVVTELDNYSSCAEGLKDGRYDAETTDNVILYGLVDKSPDDFKMVNKPFTKEPYGIGVKKTDTEFRNFINDTLEQSYKDGSWAKAYKATVGKFVNDVPEPPTVDRYTAS